MSHTTLLVIGYGVTWVSIALYLLNLGKRERRVGRGAMGSPPSNE